MPKRVIDFHDSVEFSGDWEFVKTKKQRIKVKSEKAVNSQIYMTFNDIVPLYTFLYFALAPQEAFGFQKVQPIFDKMKGDSEQSKQQFQQVRKSISLNWDGVTPLPDLIREHKKHIIRQQKNIYNISSRITEEDVKTLLKSGLSQRKVHLDFHTNDGQQEEALIPAIQNINDCITIIYEERNQKYLLAFFSHIEEKKQEEKPKQQAPNPTDNETHNHPQTFKDRPLPTKPVPNPDDRPLPQPLEKYKNSQNTIHANQRQPTYQREILNPDQKLLAPPADQVPAQRERSKSPRRIVDPDQKLLPLPPKVDPRDARKEETKRADPKVANSSSSTGKVSELKSEIKSEVKHLGEVAETKLHDLGEKAKNLGRRVEGRVEQIVEDIRHDKHNWLHLGVSAVIIGLAIKMLRE